MATKKNVNRAKARLAKLDKEAEAKKTELKRGLLRSKARMGSRTVRNEAARELNKMPRKPKQQN